MAITEMLEMFLELSAEMTDDEVRQVLHDPMWRAWAGRAVLMPMKSAGHDRQRRLWELLGESSIVHGVG